MFEYTSRYHGLETAEHMTPDGRAVVYVRRRFLPPATMAVETLAEHTVTQEDRLDYITARYLGDPEQFWRVCDSNNAMHPEALTDEIGRKLHIAFPHSELKL